MNKILFIGLALALFSSLSFAESHPEHWWKVVDRSSAPRWEILPQDARDGEVVLSKRNELGQFSNFARVPFFLDGKQYNSVEGLWQSLKYPESSSDYRAQYPGNKWSYSREEVSQMLGYAAKKAGRMANKNMKNMDINWVTYQGQKLYYWTPFRGAHYKLIYRAIYEKVTQNPRLKKLLLSTGDLRLLADHKIKSSAPPAWSYNKILMKIRKDLRH